MRPVESDDFRRQIKNWILLTHGLELDQCLAHSYVSKEARHAALAADMVAAGLRELHEMGNGPSALRCALLAQKYIGGCGGFHPNVHVADAAEYLNAELIRLMRGDEP